MMSVRTTRVLGYPWTDLFNLVLDVTSYPTFVPHCREVRLLSRRMVGCGMTVIVSRMTVGFSVFEVSYANRTTADSIGRKIRVEALDGPLHFLDAVWTFEPRDESHTQLHFSVDYEFNNPVLAAVTSRVFGAMFGKIVDAFERRAAQLFSVRELTDAKHRRR
jgi:coenzyme Q-binding protein COQ10